MRVRLTRKALISSMTIFEWQKNKPADDKSQCLYEHLNLQIEKSTYLPACLLTYVWKRNKLPRVLTKD